MACSHPSALDGEQLVAGVWPVMLTAFHQDGRIDWEGNDVLIDWYLQAGVAGLFAVCLSSEMYHLDEQERLELAKWTVRRSAGRVPVVATGTFGGQIDSQAEFIKRMADTGVDAVVVVTSQIAAKWESDDVWRQRLDKLLAQTGRTPLGLYECPLPYKRLLPPALLKEIAATGRFLFTKDTSCELNDLRAKCAVVKGSSLRLFNANTPTLLDSMLLGCSGFSGIGANCYPALYVWLCRHAASQLDRPRRVQQFLSVADMVVRHQYPLSAKLFLAQSGLSIGPTCRQPVGGLTSEERLILTDLYEMAKSVSHEIADCKISS